MKCEGEMGGGGRAVGAPPACGLARRSEDSDTERGLDALRADENVERNDVLLRAHVVAAHEAQAHPVRLHVLSVGSATRKSQRGHAQGEAVGMLTEIDCRPRPCRSYAFLSDSIALRSSDHC